jgi:hypothetical protein
VHSKYCDAYVRSSAVSGGAGVGISGPYVHPKPVLRGSPECNDPSIKVTIQSPQRSHAEYLRLKTIFDRNVEDIHRSVPGLMTML